MEKEIGHIAPEYRKVGDLILELLESKEMKQSELCDLIGIPKPVLNEVIKGRRSLNAEMAVLIESALGLSADKLLSVQCKMDLEKAYCDAKVVHQLQCMSDWAVMSKNISIPVLKKMELYESDVKNKVAVVLKMFHVSDIQEFQALVDVEHTQIYFKKSEKLNVDNKALFTWKYYCINKASQISISQPFDVDGIDELNMEVKNILMENRNTYNRIQMAFNRYGIRLLYINKVGQIPVDGMSFWTDTNPTVVITRRLSNIDNFAFSIMHEMCHVKNHLKKNSDALINIDGRDLDDIEIEANEYARDSFISRKEWDKFMYRIKNCNPYSVHIPIAKEAALLKINPQILYGRYMHDTGLYRLRRVFPTEVL